MSACVNHPAAGAPSGNQVQTGGVGGNHVPRLGLKPSVLRCNLRVCRLRAERGNHSNRKKVEQETVQIHAKNTMPRKLQQTSKKRRFGSQNASTNRPRRPPGALQEASQISPRGLQEAKMLQIARASCNGVLSPSLPRVRNNCKHQFGLASRSPGLLVFQYPGLPVSWCSGLRVSWCTDSLASLSGPFGWKVVGQRGGDLLVSGYRPVVE